MSRDSNSHSVSIVASALETVAAGLSAGQWGTLVMSGLDSSWVGGGDSFLSFGPIGQWDSLHARAVYIGGSHPTDATPYETRQYDYTSATNTWVRDNSVLPPGNGSPDHGYYHMALDPATGDLYRKRYNSDSISRRIYGGAWASLPTPPLDDLNVVTGALVWHPGLNGGVGGLILAAYEGFCSWSPSTNSWAPPLRQVSNTMGTSANHNGVYNRADQCAYFFNENKAWKVSAAGVVSPVQPPPVTPAVGTGASGGCIFSSTGTNRMVMLTTASQGKAIYEYDHVGNGWSNIGTYPFTYTNGGSFTGFTVDTYGCLFFIMTTSGNSIGTTAHIWKR